MSSNQNQPATGIPTWQERTDDTTPGAMMMAMEREIADLRAQLAQHERAYRIVLDTCEGAAHALIAARDMVSRPEDVAFINRAIADPTRLAQLARHGQAFAKFDLTDYSTAVNYSNGTSTPVAAPPEQQARAVPDGWKQVPVEPTQEMFDAARTSASGSSTEKLMMASYWRAMLAAAPSPAAQPTVEVKIERGRVWIAKGGQSFMLAYEPDEGDDPAEMQAYADNLRSVLSGFTPCVNSTAQPVAQVGEQPLTPHDSDIERMLDEVEQGQPSAKGGGEGGQA